MKNSIFFIFIVGIFFAGCEDVKKINELNEKIKFLEEQNKVLEKELSNFKKEAQSTKKMFTIKKENK